MKKTTLILAFAGLLATSYLAGACYWIDPINPNVSILYPCDPRPLPDGGGFQYFDCGDPFYNDQGLYDCAYVPVCCPL